MSQPFSKHCAIELDRRAVMGVGAAFFAGLAVRPAHATPELETAIRRFTGGAMVKSGKVTLDIAPLVENGNAVGVEVLVDHPMKPDSFVKSIALFTEKNPAPEVAVFHLTPRSGRAHVVTRMRLATTQHVTALAQLSDGSFWQDTREVIVTIAACTEE
jgi:sulfur-oxidizing protein SoxY